MPLSLLSTASMSSNFILGVLAYRISFPVVRFECWTKKRRKTDVRCSSRAYPKRGRWLLNVSATAMRGYAKLQTF
ncbi:hypothetical protein EDD16DRAFT_1554895 [Pisolithus croceorrhizus]|nr:hypothetical protein EDD16DRAFT_1554895 [Pisolithus croceorrhizus]